MATSILKKLILLPLLLGMPIAIASKEKVADVDSIWQGKAPYVQVVVTNSDFEEDFDIDLLADSVFYEIAGSLVYPVNIFTLPRSAQLLTDIDSIVVPMAQSHDWQLLAMHLRGAASPEGPETWNKTLGERRARSLLKYITARIGESEKARVVMDNGVEDYIGLCFFMKRNADPDALRVSEIVARCKGNNAAIKRELKALDNGRVWKRLLREVFPQLRAARLVLYFRPIVHRQRPKGEIVLADIDPRMAEINYLPSGPLTVPQPTIAPSSPAATDRLRTRRHLLSVSTNLAYDAFWMPDFGMAPMPNIEIEYYPKRGNWTFLASITFPYWHKWEKNEFFQLRDYHLEARRYFGKKRHSRFFEEYERSTDTEGKTDDEQTLSALHTGFFLAAYVNANIYGIGLSADKGWQGEGAGAALKAGYVWKLSKSGRWRLELSAAVGGYLTRYDPYVYGNPVTNAVNGKYYYDYKGKADNFKKRNYQRVWFGPTEFGVHLRYDILYRRIAKKGFSFNRKEVAQ